MVYYKLVKITINASNFVKLIINIVIRYYSLLDSIINQKFFFYLISLVIVILFF